ncbi:hypothetical protein DUZ99_05255 [Xylanibacillus composti]|uniref:DUF5668 domain-containing protein n=1 Tax=Xylanibacillus composti TaxID=1572762 RepID=A0A8J4H1R9_9BACL|nr:hypothetical protein [Xylanibacillus composti]MDT9724395.1 hypothetical protein [Xylanibacillus composti]GIQ67990.1 hypothetical protein XYCOK13_08140 [Xylanibacillus composti]
MRNRQYSVGLLIILLGIVILLGKTGVFSFAIGMLWPLFVLVPGLLFHFFYFSRMMPSGVLIPGGILVTVSILFFICNFFGWHHMAWLWPGFILAVAIGLYEFYLFDNEHPKGVLTAAIILGVLAAVFFTFTVLFTSGIYFVAVALILVGAFMMFRRPRF